MKTKSVYHKFNIPGYTRREVISFIKMKLTVNSQWMVKAVERLNDFSKSKMFPGYGFNRMDVFRMSVIAKDLSIEKVDNNKKLFRYLSDTLPKYASQIASICTPEDLKDSMDKHMEKVTEPVSLSDLNLKDDDILLEIKITEKGKNEIYGYIMEYQVPEENWTWYDENFTWYDSTEDKSKPRWDEDFSIYAIENGVKKFIESHNYLRDMSAKKLTNWLASKKWKLTYKAFKVHSKRWILGGDDKITYKNFFYLARELFNRAGADSTETMLGDGFFMVRSRFIPEWKEFTLI